MKKILFSILIGFILAQALEYGSCEIVNIMQRKCYPLWTEGEQNKYQQCMNNEQILNISKNIIGFNFIYTGRKLILGY